MKNNNRPVHLNLFKIRLPVVAVLSILHRVTGVFMALAMPVVIYFFGLSLQSAEGYAQAGAFFSQPLVKAIVILFLWFLMHHLIAGIRYLLIDVDIGVEKPAARRSAWWVNIAGVVMTALVAVVVL